MQRRDFLLSSLLASALPATVWAAQYPQRTLSWVVPYAAGGGTDVVARALAEAMARQLGQTVVIENKPGANTAIGASQVARAKPDGYVVGSADNATLALNQHLFPSLAYDPLQDFSFVGGIARFPYVLVVHPDSPIKTLQDLLEAARKEPGAISYGSPGMGGPNHVAMEMLQQQTGTQFLHVSYRGAAPVMQDLIAGQIKFSLIDTASSMPFITSGRARAIAVSHGARLQTLPDVPTFAEAGVADFVAFSWQGMIAPRSTPAPVIERLNSALNQALADAKVKQTLASMSVEAAGSSAQDFERFVREQAQLWGKVVKDAGIKLQA